MTFTYDLSNNIGKVRLLIPDKDTVDYVWTDEEIISFLSIEDGIRRAAALALETMASDDLIVLKVMKIQNIETNTDRMALQLLKRAVMLREQAEKAEDNDGDGFDIVPMIVNEHAREEQLYNVALRDV